MPAPVPDLDDPESGDDDEDDNRFFLVGAQRGEAAVADDDDFGGGYGDDFEADEDTRDAPLAPGRLRDRIKMCRMELVDSLGPSTFDLAYRALKARSWDADYSDGVDSFDEIAKILAVSTAWPVHVK